MTLNKAYRVFALTIILMAITIIFYAYNVSRLFLPWGMAGFVVAVLVSLTSSVLIIHDTKKPKNLSVKRFKIHYEFLDWLSFLSLSLMSIFILFTFIILPSDVSQSSMHPTLENGDRILIYHFAYKPIRDDVVVIRITQADYALVPPMSFVDPKSGEMRDEIYFVKRVMAMPGDLVEFVNYHEVTERYQVSINGEVAKTPLDTIYTVSEDQKANLEQALDNGIVIAGQVLTFGDNAASSLDSRGFGPVREVDIVGKVILRLWPLGGVR